MSMTKKRLTTTLPDGTTADRTTARAYTHVLAVGWDNATELAHAQSELARIEGYIGNGCWTEEQVAPRRAEVADLPTEGIKWSAYSWHASEALAAKAAATAAKTHKNITTQIVTVNTPES